ncbi:hypothetical protein P4654_25425 [Niallia taxi]|uniref:DUF6941 family protein n=1 Tax=Niallia taxi TaxID=2499688 RepID=UPI002E1E7DF5|nr:hypothetical protein [Niallia taxi]MED4118060.1 hypothetical protein [Niallia taxi]
MPKVATFMYCERAEQDQNGKIQISNPLLAMIPLYVPGTFSFSVVFSVTGITIDQDNSIRILFKGPNESEAPLVDTGDALIPKGALDTPIDTRDVPIEFKGMMFNLDFRNINLKYEGIYTSIVYINGDLTGEFPIYVKAGEPQ